MSELPTAPASFAQERIWYLEQRREGTPAINAPPASFRLVGALDAGALRAAIDEIVRRHSVVRSVFPPNGSRPVQVVRPHRDVELAVVDLADVPLLRREWRLRRLMTEDASRPFDLTRDLLLRATLFRLGPFEHVLQVVMHHIAWDAWSMGVLAAELGLLYNALVVDGIAGPPAPALQYADHARWQHEALQAGAFRRSLDHWKRSLAGVPQVLDVAGDHPRPARQSLRGGVCKFEITAECSARLAALARAERTTTYAVLLAAWQALVGRYTGVERFIVGMPVGGRTRPGWDELLGLFVNQLPLVADLRRRPTFREMIRRARASIVDALDHQDVPVELIMREVNVRRDPSHSALAQVIFNLLPERDAPIPRLHGLHVEPVVLDSVPSGPLYEESETLHYDLYVVLGPYRGGYRGALNYATDIYRAPTARRLVRQFLRVVDAIAAAPDTPIADLELISRSERSRLRRWALGAGRRLSPDLCLNDLVRRGGFGAGQAVAVRAPDGTATFRELEAWADVVRGRLAALGVGPEARVGVCLSRSRHLPSALLGILEAGAAYVPLDPENPASRLRMIAADAGLGLVLTDARLRPRLAALDVPVVLLEDWLRRPSGPVLSRRRSLGGGLAYVMYTSGSTGAPKGVMVEHGSVVNYLLWAAEAYSGTGGRGSAVFSPIGFDLTVTALYVPLMLGEPVILAPGEDAVSALQGLVGERRQYRFLKMTPSQLDVLTAVLDEGGTSVPTRSVVTGGDVLTFGQVTRLRELDDGVGLLNEYGPTETTVGCTMFPVASTASPEPVQPIGRPITNTSAYVLDDALRRCPIGATGELFIGGVQVARGYVDRPAETAERFLPDPFQWPGRRMYRTGDMARWRSDGTLVFAGRRDEQTKIRGYRVEIGEVRTALERHPAVASAAVVPVPGTHGHRHLAAYVVPADGGRCTVDEVVEHARAHLPEYLVPASIDLVDALPLTANGKLDVGRLPPPAARTARAAIEVENGYRTDVERSVAAVWRDVLDVADPGPSANFFELGGDSVLAVRVVSILRTIGLPAAVRDVERAQTIRSWAAALESRLQRALGEG